MSRLGRLSALAIRDPREAARRVRRRLGRAPTPGGSRLEVFTAVYADAGWGSTESGSGTGSELRATEVIRAELADVLRSRQITSLLDSPCGDWNWMQHVDLTGVTYWGLDIVPSVIEQNAARFVRPGVTFGVADLTRDSLPRVEAVLCRDCMVHVSYADIAAMLANFRRTGATWLFLNDYPEQTSNHDQPTGRDWRRLNFQIAPFHFPAPVETWSDGGEVDPSQLSLWRIEDLPDLRL